MSGGTTGIQWTDATWNPVVGCTPVSPGCLNCYAATMARRLEAMGQKDYEPRDATVDEIAARHAGGVNSKPSIDKLIRIAEVRGGRAVFTGEVRTLEHKLTAPLHWKKPRMIFVNSMSDLFHEAVPFEYIDKVFAVAALCPRHTFQILTKRPERMAEYLTQRSDGMSVRIAVAARELVGRTDLATWVTGKTEQAVDYFDEHDGVLPNVWLGTSVEDQARADERIPHLLKCPAAVRFLSCEPLLGAVDLSKWLAMADPKSLEAATSEIVSTLKAKREGRAWEQGKAIHIADALHWVIVGGESGANARACNLKHVASIVEQCKAAGVPVFVKQLGSWGWCERPKGRRDRKGGDMAEWPEDLRVREMPERDDPPPF